MAPTCATLATDFLPGLEWRPLHFERPLPREKVCQLCGVVCKKTVLLPCFHILCDVCFEGSLALGCVCPLDSEVFDQDDVDKLMLRPAQVLKLRVSCWNSANGCDFVGPVSGLLDHFEKECIHHTVPCPKCLQNVPRPRLVQHYANGCSPNIRAQAPRQDGTHPRGQLREHLESARAEIVLCLAELKDGYHELQASVNTIADNVNLWRTDATQEIDEALSSLVAQLQTMRSDLNSHVRQSPGFLERNRAEIKQCIAELKDGYHGLQVSVNTASSEANRAITEAMSSHLEQIRAMQLDANSRAAQSFDILERAMTEVKQSMAELRDGHSVQQASVDAVVGDIKPGRSEERLSDKKIEIKDSEMSAEMQQDAVEVVTRAVEKCNTECGIARYIVDAFNKKYKPHWQSIVGCNFTPCSYYTPPYYIRFNVGERQVVLFK